MSRERPSRHVEQGTARRVPTEATRLKGVSIRTRAGTREAYIAVKYESRRTILATASCILPQLAGTDRRTSIVGRAAILCSASCISLAYVRTKRKRNIRRDSACMTEESIGSRMEGNHALRRHESRIQGDTSRFTPEYRLRLGKQCISSLVRTPNGGWCHKYQSTMHSAFDKRRRPIWRSEAI